MNNLQLKDHLRLAFVISLALGVSACAPAPMMPPDNYGYSAPAAYPQQQNEVYYEDTLALEADADAYPNTVPPSVESDYTDTVVPDDYQPVPRPVARPTPIPVPIRPAPVVRPAPVPVARPAPKPKQKPVVNTIIAESTTSPFQDAGSVQVETLEAQRPTRPSVANPTSPITSSNAMPASRHSLTERTTRRDNPSTATFAPRAYPLSPAAGSLLESAKTEAARNNLGRAGDLMERALRIEPDNPTLWMQLAQFRKLQGDNSQAIAMAKRAAQAQPDDVGLEKQSWGFIAGIYRMTGDQAGLAEALSHQ